LGHKTLIYISLSITIAIAVVSLMPINQQIAPHVQFLDKVVHAVMYFVLSFSWLKTFSGINKSVYYFYSILLIVLLYGIIIEVLQSVLTTYRKGDFYDVMANLVGIIIAGIVFKHSSQKN